MKMRLIDGYVVDLSEDPDVEFHESLAKQFVDVPPGAPDDLRVGYRYQDGEWAAPQLPQDPEPSEEEPQTTYRKSVSKVEYYGFFTPLEEATIRLTASKTVTAEMVEAASPEDRQKLMAVLVLRVMLDRVDKLAATQIIQLDDAQVLQGLGLCVQMGLLEDHRPAEITRGVKEN